MYGAVLGKHKNISLKELDILAPKNLIIKSNIALFDTNKPEAINTLAGIIKWGKLTKISDIKTADIIGTNNQSLGKYLKKNGVTRRFKEVDLTRTDDEVKNKGKECIVIGEDWDDDQSEILEITGYQNISLYEIIDFDKPVSSMKIGMMPAKLTHMMINIGLHECGTENPTIYDPFVGLGTTAFLANALEYDCIASDIDITSMKQNLPWRQEQEIAHSDKRITVFKHDIFEPLKKPFLKNVQLIVTEGWLGPVITEKTSEKEIYKAQDEIVKLYKAFLNNIHEFYDKITVVFTIPIHQGVASYVQESVAEHCEKLNLSCEFIKEVYKRAGQKVGRQIVIVSK